mmetsp:Transcript_61098/g.83961  ORF Transcript_61098/g.83961 Transcript_61098/m.83961 type:complete len:81 (+) Transcript_61098:1384-1626(+)
MQDGKREASTHDQLFARQKEYEERRRQKAELKEEMETADVRDKPSRDTAIPKHIQDKLAEKQSGNIHARLYDDAEKNQAK